MEKKPRKMLTSFTILILMILALAVLSWIVAAIPDSGVTAAGFSTIIRSVVDGFSNAAGSGADLIAFIFCIGGFLGIVNSTGALDTGIATLVRKLNGREEILIAAVMFVFSIGGTTYGMCEETVPFYIMLASTMVAAGMDTLTGALAVALGAGVGVLGSTINPFCTMAAVGALDGVGISVDTGKMIALGVVLWLSSYAIALYFVLKYAKKVKADKGSTFLSLQEQKIMEDEFSKGYDANAKLSGKQKLVLWIFGLSFAVMICGFIPWEDYGVTLFSGWSEFIMGEGIPMGYWYFDEGATLFFIMAIVIGFIYGMGEAEFVETFIRGSADLISVAFIIAVARGATVLMGNTGLGEWLVNVIADTLRGVPGFIYAPLAYILYLPLSFLVPSTSGLAGLSMPIMGPVTDQLGFSVEVMILIFSAANGLINLFAPTAGALMGGLQTAKIEYPTYMKAALKPIIVIGIANIIIVTVAMMIM
ncbi:MAG: YfcC family protein [Erysipelotrichaceae bacterium]|nr:YfcC family protein [Erysipelotrichaceae bacterium]